MCSSKQEKMPSEAREFPEDIPAEVPEGGLGVGRNNVEDGGNGDEDSDGHDENDSSTSRVTDATQTEGDVVDGAALFQPHPLLHHNNNGEVDIGDGPSCSNGDGNENYGSLLHLREWQCRNMEMLIVQKFLRVLGGFLSSLFTMVRPSKRREGEGGVADANSRSVGTQTEEQDPICARGWFEIDRDLEELIFMCASFLLLGQQLSHLLIQELSLQNRIPSSYKDDVYESLASCVCDMLVKHSILFHGMVRRCQVTNYHIFCCIANEIFEVSCWSKVCI